MFAVLLLDRNNGVTIVLHVGKHLIHTIRTDKFMGDSHEQLEGLVRGLSPVVIEVHPNTLKINTNTHLAILKVPRGRHGDKEFDGKIVPNKCWLQ